jgi:ADP-ribosyl-[dinitrogen reductase] hydrolase
MIPPMTSSIHMKDLQERARAAFIGLAIGDALGATVEFMTPSEIKAKFGLLREISGGGWLRLRPGQVTDDTEMSLCIARALVSAGGWSLQGIAENFSAWLRSKPIDIGDTCRRGIRNYMLKGEMESPPNQWDAGNGACMRILPVALFTLGNDELLENYSIAQGHITHNHPYSDAACIAMGRLVQLALLGISKSRLRRELESFLGEHESFRFEPFPGLSTAYVVDTIQTVLHFFFKTRDFEDCLVQTVNQGGDADTTGAIAGMLAGSYYGMESIPKRWLRKMDKGLLDEITELTGRLLELSAMNKGKL